MLKHGRNAIVRWLGMSALVMVLVGPAIPPGIAAAANETVTVNFALNGGTPTHRATGFIYGLAQNATTPAQTLLSQIKVKFMRAGGPQIGCPNGGWINGGYAPRWSFIKAYYAKARAVGSKYIMLLPGIWGAVGRCTVPRYPGGGSLVATAADRCLVDNAVNDAASSLHIEAISPAPWPKVPEEGGRSTSILNVRQLIDPAITPWITPGIA